MILFACPTCKTKLKATPDQVGTKFPCPKCGQRLQVPPSQTAVPIPRQSPSVSFDFSSPTAEASGQEGGFGGLDQGDDGPAFRRRSRGKTGILPTFLAWCCPISLFICCFVTLLYYHAYGQMPRWQRQAVEMKQENPNWVDPGQIGRMPSHVSALGTLMFASMAGGLAVTVVTFVLGIMKSHKLAITLSSVTFVLSFPLIYLSGPFGYR